MKINENSLLAKFPSLSSTSDRLKLLQIMMLSREAEYRENILFRQGRGQFHLPSAGHESMAAISSFILPEDWTYAYYRDRALLLGLGVPLYEMALGFFGKARSSSGGRQMASHFSHSDLKVVSCATPTALQCLPASGTAWSLKKENKAGIVFCCIGDASTRQGEFLESLAFSIQEKLPIIYLIEDNGYGISTKTESMTPLALGMLPSHLTSLLDGTHPLQLYEDMSLIVENVRNGHGPHIAWIKLDRLMSHTSSDCQEKYRAAVEIEHMKASDPLVALKQSIILEGDFSSRIETLETQIKEQVRDTYKQAETAADPDPSLVTTHIFSDTHSTKRFDISELCSLNQISMVESFNLTLRKILEENPKATLFGEDIEDPKGGVFGLTKGLSTSFPSRVHNSPLAEATIAGLSSGMALEGFLPIFELQFIDFIGPAFNQIVNQIATLRWRSVGNYKCPLIIYGPCGSYISGGGPWHSQTNEAWLAHAPGLKVYMPSTAIEASSMLYHAAHGEDPVIMLLPKNQFQNKTSITNEYILFPERARIKRQGNDLTIIAWGNCTELALMSAYDLMKVGIDAEIVDLNSIVPCDWETLEASVRKTGRLLVIQEDNQTCSFGQTIISQIITKYEIWSVLQCPPCLISRPDVHIGFHHALEAAVLPSKDQIVSQAIQMMKVSR